MKYEKFILFSFLGNSDYTNENKYTFKDFLPFNKNKINAKCSFEAILKNLDVENLVLFLTKEAKDKLKECDLNIEPEIINLKGNESFNELLRKFLKSLREYSEYKRPIIIDLTHSFRHFSILKFLSALIGNSLLEDLQIYVLYAKEKKKNEYEFIELNEYIDYFELFEAIEYFVNDLYVPEFFHKKLNLYFNKNTKEKEIELIFKELYKLGVAIRENNFFINNKAIWDIGEEILDKIDDLEKQVDFLKEVFKYEEGNKFKNILENIKELKYKEDYEKLISLAELTFEKRLLLNSAVYLMEGMAEYVYWSFKDKKFLKKEGRPLTPEEYKNSFEYSGKYKTLECLKKIIIYELIYNGEGNSYKPNCSYNKDLFKQIVEDKKELWKEFSGYLKDIDKIRNNMTHVFRDEIFQSYEKEIEKILDKAKELIENLNN